MKQYAIAIMSKGDFQLSFVGDALCFSQWNATVFDPGAEMSEDKMPCATCKCGPNSACGRRMQVFCSVVLGVFEKGRLMNQYIHSIQSDDSRRLFRCVA
jgi:hypothetical protein